MSVSFLRLKVNRKWLHVYTLIAGFFRLLQWESQSLMFPSRPGLCNRAVNTAARHSEGKAGVDLPPLWHQQRRLHQQRGDAALSQHVFTSAKVSLQRGLFSRKWQRLWEPSMTWWANTPTLRWRGTSHSSTWTLSFRFVCDHSSQTGMTQLNRTKESDAEVLPQESHLRLLNLFCFIFIFYFTDSVFFSQKMDKNKDGVVTLEEFVIACQEVRGTNGNQRHCLFIISKLAHYIKTTLPIFFSCTQHTHWTDSTHQFVCFCTGWNYDEIHAAVWERDVGENERMRTKTWQNKRTWRQHACVDASLPIHPASPPHTPIFSAAFWMQTLLDVWSAKVLLQ